MSLNLYVNVSFLIVTAGGAVRMKMFNVTSRKIITLLSNIRLSYQTTAVALLRHIAVFWYVVSLEVISYHKNSYMHFDLNKT